jgi:hypothetical protein
MLLNIGGDVEQAELLRKLGALKRNFGLLKGSPEEMTTEDYEDKKLKIMSGSGDGLA